MTYFHRQAEVLVRDLFDGFPVVVVTGARQVGKSTMLAHLVEPGTEVVTFDPVLDVGLARQDPELFLDQRCPPLVLDEIQYAPELVATLKRRIDRDRRPGQYLLTGSQQWGVLRSMAESLAGRAVFVDLEGFSLAEVAGRGAESRSWLEVWLEEPGESFLDRVERLQIARSLDELIWRGWLPEAQTLALRRVPKMHEGYLRTYVERDVRVLAEVSDQQSFGRFFGLAAATTGQEVNFRKLGRELGVTHQTAGRWLNVLRATFQWRELPAFRGNLRRRISGRPKGFLSDTGLAAHAMAISTHRALLSHPAWGALFETAAVSELRKLASIMAVGPRMHHWRSHGGAEVDVVLERDGRIYPIEVKASTRLGRTDCSGLRAFREAHAHLDVAPGLVVAPVSAIGRLSESDWAIPWDLVPVSNPLSDSR